MLHFADRLLQRIRAKGAPVCVGIDPVLERLPVEIRDTNPPALAIITYCSKVLHAIKPHAPVVKFQSACFERYHDQGIIALRALIKDAKQMGFIVILDAKRGDIGISAAHYAAADLADTPDSPGPDALTVNPYLGPDTLQPFLDVCEKQHKGLFALVRTSNPGSDAIQSLQLADGRTVAQAVASVITQLGSQPRYLGSSGYSCLGAVIGATKPADAASLRQALPSQFFLVPGFGAQGAGPEDVRACFKPDHTGAIITASRSITYAYESNPDVPWHQAVADAALDMKQQIQAILNT